MKEAPSSIPNVTRSVVLVHIYHFSTWKISLQHISAVRSEVQGHLTVLSKSVDFVSRSTSSLIQGKFTLMCSSRQNIFPDRYKITRSTEFALSWRKHQTLLKVYHYSLKQYNCSSSTKSWERSISSSDIRGLSAMESLSAHSSSSIQGMNLHFGTIWWPGVLNYETNGELLPDADSSFAYHSSQNMND